VDDTGIIVTNINPINFKSSVNEVFQDINRLITTNLLSLNVNKTQFIIKTSSLINLNAIHGNKKIVNARDTKFFGLTLNNTFSWKTHVGTVVLKLSSDFSRLEQLSHSCPKKHGRWYIIPIFNLS
jgi:hypothetical protein